MSAKYRKILFYKKSSLCCINTISSYLKFTVLQDKVIESLCKVKTDL